MKSSVAAMIDRYEARTPLERRHAAKEVMQEIALCGLARGGFFDHVAFYGGTALRIFYGLDRFSEDMDFSLMAPDETFDLAAFFPVLEAEAASHGLSVTLERKEKTRESDIQSAFLKGNTREHLLHFYPEEDFFAGIPRDEKLKIKFEVDVNPPALATFERRYQLLPAPYEVNLYDGPSLFAGKIHAVLCRSWKNRVKGRDLYDYLFYLSRGIGVNLPHLRERLLQTGNISSKADFTLGTLKSMLAERFDAIDMKAAARDVEPFLNDPRSLDAWCPNLFKQATESLREA